MGPIAPHCDTITDYRNMFKVGRKTISALFPVGEKKRAIMTRLIYRVWKDILGIRDWTEIQYRIQENAKWFNGIRDLTTTREAA